MRVWVVKDGETLPVQAESRPMRTWMLADALTARGHEVTWWAGTFLHHSKELVAERDAHVVVRPGFDLRLIHAGRYKRHVSPARYWHHVRLGRGFRTASEKLPPPAAIVCSFPPIQLAYAVAGYARQRGIPLLVDVRDLWPDTIVNVVPKALRPVARAALARDYKMTRSVMQGADALIAVSPDSLAWGLRQAARGARELDRVFYTGHPGVDAPPREPTERLRALGETTRGKVVLVFAGSFGHAWDVEFLCDAAAVLRNDPAAMDIHFVLAGGGSTFAAVERRSRGLPNVTVLGWLNRYEMRDLLAVADVGLAPHSMPTEALPNKLFEFLAGGLPVLSSLRGEAERLLARHGVGYTYPHGDVHAFAELAVKLAADRELRKAMGRRARALYEAEFSSGVAYDQFATHVEHVAAATAGAA